MTDPKLQKVWIDAIKSCGQSLIDNAESIAGDFDFQTDTDIVINLKPRDFARISVTSNYIPKDINDKTKLATTIPSWQGKCDRYSYCINIEEADNDKQ